MNTNDDMPRGRPQAQAQGDIRPIPDPTELTNQLVSSAISNLREVMETRLRGLETVVDLASGRLDQIEKDSLGIHQHMRDDFIRDVNFVKQHTAAELDTVRAVHLEKFNAIEIQFTQRDKRLEQSDEERRISLNAAFAAAKEAGAEQNKSNNLAISKSEEGTKDTMKKQEELLRSATNALADKIEDLKDRFISLEARVISIESVKSGATEAKTERRSDTGQVIAFVIAGVAIISIFVSVLLSLKP